MMINLTKLILIGYTQRYYNLCITGTWGYMIPYWGSFLCILGCLAASLMLWTTCLYLITQTTHMVKATAHPTVVMVLGGRLFMW